MPGWGKGSLRGASLARRVVVPAARAFAVCFPLTLIVALSSPRADVVLHTAGQEQGAPGGSRGGWSSSSDLPVLGLGGPLGDPLADEVPRGVVAAIGAPAGTGTGGSFTESGASAPFGITSVTALTSSGIPLRAYQAYLKAQSLMVRDRATCHLSWSLVAGIGRVESNHGRFGGSGFAADGRVVPPILGILLDGSRSAAIRDSDRGAYDGSSVWDRAVGPMQFLPSTWNSYGGDANGDGRRDPQQIDDAAYGTARYLCAGGTDLATASGRYAAVYRYNHSDSYVRLVLSLADTYATGRASTVPDVVPTGGHDGSDGPGGTSGGTPPGIGGNEGPGSTPTPTRTTPSPTTTSPSPTTTSPSPTTTSPSPTTTPTWTPTTPDPTGVPPSPTDTWTPPSPTPTTPTSTPTDTCLVTPDPTDTLVTPTVPPGCPTPTTTTTAAPVAPAGGTLPDPTPSTVSPA